MSGLATSIANNSLGWTWWLSILAFNIGLVVVLLTWDLRHSRATHPRPRRMVRVPHKSGPIIPFPSRSVRLWCQLQAKRHREMRHYRSLRRRRLGEAPFAAKRSHFPFATHK